MRRTTKATFKVVYIVGREDLESSRMGKDAN
jgi:hypothetical protein